MALSRKRSVLAKIESTAGTAVTPTLSDRVTMSDYSPTPLEAENVERQLFRPFVGAAPVLIGGKTTILNPTCEMVGGGLYTDGNGKDKAPIRPQFHALLQACGMVEAAIKKDGSAAKDKDADHAGWRYTVGDPTKAKSVTIISQVDGIQQIVKGCRGTFVISGEIGAVPTIAFTMTGIYGRPLSKALPTGGTAPTDVPPQLFSGDNTAWDGASQLSTVVPCVYSFSADCGHLVETVDCAARTTGTGLKVEITDRTTTGAVVADAKVDTTDAGSPQAGDPWSVAGTGTGTAVAEAGTTSTPTGLIRHGTKPGAWWTVGGPSISIGAITEEDRAGILAYNHPLTFSPTGAGNNELTLTFWGKLD